MSQPSDKHVFFICRCCGEPVGDPCYRGPIGHAPPNVCYACWLNAFDAPSPHWPREVLMLWMLANGFTRKETAVACRMTRRTVSRWLMHLRADAEAFFHFVSHFSDFGVIRRLRKGGVR